MRGARIVVAAGMTVAVMAVGGVDASFAQDAKAGAAVFNQCRICHQIGAGAQNAIGPVLTGVVGRKAATYPGYDYSDALKSAGLTWTPENLTKWLKNPAALVAGTKMTFPGLSSDADIANVIAYLKSNT